MSKPKRPEAQPEQFQTIDPAALANVGGGAARASSSGGNEEVMAALTSVLDSLQSLGNQKQQGMDPMTMMMMMMMMGGGGGGGPVAQASPYANTGGYAGYTVDGVFYPFK
jgi:hypothetical protein